MQKNEENKNQIEEMFKVGAHYGYTKSRRHPSTSPYIYGTKNKTDIIDLEKTNIELEEMKKFIQELASKNKTILFVGTKPEAKMAILDLASKLSMPYVIERWIGGTLSNFVEIKKRITELENYQKDNALGNLEKYTKKERVVMAKKMERLAKYYTGLIGVKKTPDAIFIIDAKKETIALKEAKTVNLKVMAIVNTDTNIKNIDYPVIANDASLMSIKFFTDFVLNAYRSGEDKNIKA